MKNLIKRAINEFKIGWSLSKLPEHILNIEKNIYVKLIKILGPVCVFLIVSGIAQQFNKLIFYYIFMFSFLYSLYRIIIVLYYIKQFIFNVYTGKLIVRNSPVNHNKHYNQTELKNNKIEIPENPKTGKLDKKKNK